MDDDFSLLQSYACDKSDAAFETLMGRHTDLVYSSALRLTGDSHLAEEFTQAVFIVLARKAPQLKASVVLPAWLLTVTKLSAANAIQHKHNQRKIEQETAALHQRNSSTGTADEGSHIAPLLDGAIAELNESDRAAVVLVYFKRCSIQEVAAQLSISHAAADKRVLRALERLRRIFARKSLLLSAGVLAAWMTEHSVHAAPAGLNALPGVLAAAKAGVHVSNSTIVANGAIKAMAVGFSKKLAACAVLFLCVGFAAGLAIKFRFGSQAPASMGDPPAIGAALAQTTPIEAVAKTLPADAVAPAPPAQPPAQLEQPNLPAIDLLTAIDPDADSVHGDWRVEGGVLYSDGRTAFGRVELPYVPGEEYDFKTAFTVLAPCSDVALIFTKNGQRIVWKMGAWGNHANMFESRRSTRMDVDHVFSRGQRVEVVVQVRLRSVAAYVDGNLASWLPPENSYVSTSTFWKLNHADALGIGAYGTQLQIDAAEVVDITGRGHFLRAPGEKGVPRVKPQLSDEALWQDAVNLMPLIDPGRDAVTGKWSITERGLKSAAAPYARLEIPYKPPEEYDFRIVFTRDADYRDISQILGKDEKSFQWRMSEGSAATGWSSSFQCLNAPKFEGTNPTTALNVAVLRGKKYTSIAGAQEWRGGVLGREAGVLLERRLRAFPNAERMGDADAGAAGAGQQQQRDDVPQHGVAGTDGKGRARRGAAKADS